jgi:hypothetical protein
MTTLSRDERQAVIDEYMDAAGASVVVPGDFIEWLRPQHNHVAHRYFFAKSEAAAAQEYRSALFRQFANGLRVTVRVTMSDPVSSHVSVNVREFPALVSHVGGRKAGGGYQPFDHEDPASVAELRRQGAVALRAWLARYRGVMELTGVSVAQVEEIAAKIEGRVALSA